MNGVKVYTNFDAGSIDVIDIRSASNLIFKIRSDTNSKFRQWFYFSINGVKDKALNVNLIDMATTAYPDGWNNYNVMVSYDNHNWFRLKTGFDGDTLNFSITPTANSIYFAYFEPYPYTKHLHLIGFANSFDMVNHEILGLTTQARAIDLLTIGDPDANYKVWIIARQHPGESMASWFMEGLIRRLLNDSDAVRANLLNNCVFYLVPNMNPDGCINGNLRTNTNGANLNREWLSPSMELSPEVYLVRQQMLATGVDMFFDIHGDEGLPYVFTAGCEVNTSYSIKQAKLMDKFKYHFELVNPDYQTKVDYGKAQPNSESATIATNWVGNQFDCLALTLEMPFKDNINLPNKNHGWNGQRSFVLGESMLVAINSIICDY